MAPAPRTAVRVLSCPNCGGAITLRAPGASVSAICSSCGSTVDVANAMLRVIATAQANTRTPTIPIGTRAELVGTEWEVVGFQQRSDPGPGWSWDEFLLFSPYQGFRFLVHDEADWTLYALLRQDVPEPANGVGDGRRYTPLRRGQARTDYVLGEFYWRVRVGDTVEVQEFAADPFLLSREQNGEEVTWSRGVQLSAATVRTAFALQPAAVPATALDRASRRRDETYFIWASFVVAVAAVLACTAIPLDRYEAAPVFQQSYTATAADRGHPMVSVPFAVPGRAGNLAISARAAVRNSWVQLGWSLVDQGSGRAFNASSTVEAYDGVDSDGAWSEGSQNALVVFPSVPAGTYRLLVDVDATALQPGLLNAVMPASVSFEVTVTRHVFSTLNLCLALLLLLPYPLFRWLTDWATRARTS